MAAKYPAIPEPTIKPESLRDAVLSLKQAFEILTGQRGNPEYAAFIGPLPEAAITPPVTTLPANSITVTPAGNIAATNVQTALVELDTEKVAKLGDTMSGHLSLPTTPAAANAVRRDYVDTINTALTTAIGDKVAKAGDTMTNFLTLHADPTANFHASTKQYADNTVVSGMVIGSAVGTYTSNATLATIIPVDNTIPQITEGVQLISLSYTPKLSTSKLLCVFTGWGAPTAADNISCALFNGAANAFSASMISASAGFKVPLNVAGSYSPGATTAQTISVRVGGNVASNVAMHGPPAGQLLGGAGVSTLVVYEIK